MKKIFILMIVVYGTFSFVDHSSAFNDGILLKYYHKNSLLRKEIHTNKKWLGEIIVVPNDPFDEKEAAIIINRIGNLPESLLEKIVHHKIKIKLFIGVITENKTAAHLKGKTPKGYSEGRTWDTVPGMGGSQLVLVKIGASENGMDHGSVNLELHELAHSIDKIVFNGIRSHPQFLTLWERERENIFQNNPYMLNYPEEYFAECFAHIYASTETRNELKKRAPETYEWISSLK